MGVSKLSAKVFLKVTYSFNTSLMLIHSKKWSVDNIQIKAIDFLTF